MNYLLEIKAFYDRLEVKPLSASAIALWHALMHTCNKTGWAEEFSVAVTVLSLKSGLSDRSVSNARNELKTKGYIDFRSRSGNRSAVYKMNSLSANFADKFSGSVSDNPSDSVSGSTADNPSALYKQNKTKQKKKKESDSFSDQVQEIWDHYIQTFDGFFPRGLTLTQKRRSKIEARLKDRNPEEKSPLFSVDDIKLAISNIRQSPWHCGDNPGSKFYADVEFICRSTDMVEKWMNYQPKDHNGKIVNHPSWEERRQREEEMERKRLEQRDRQMDVQKFIEETGLHPMKHGDEFEEWLRRKAQGG